MKRLAVTVAAVLVLVLPAAAGATVIGGGGGGGGGGACVAGIMNGEGDYSGSIPYYGSNAYVQLSTQITNVNVLGFFGTADVSTYSSGHVSQTFVLGPWGSITFAGPTYTTPSPNTHGVPFKISLSPVSDAVELEYLVCV
jgi:hypothetical protein